MPACLQIIDDRRLLGLPLNGRRLMELVSLSPGLISGGLASATERQANYGASFSVAGHRDNTSAVLIDGTENSGQELNNYPFAMAPLDSVAEFRVQRSSYSAEFGGNSGAVINVASKGGSNDFHATLYEFLRNDALDARNCLSTTVDRLKRNQFGFVANGPVVLPKLYNGKMFGETPTNKQEAFFMNAVAARGELGCNRVTALCDKRHIQVSIGRIRVPAGDFRETSSAPECRKGQRASPREMFCWLPLACLSSISPAYCRSF